MRPVREIHRPGNRAAAVVEAHPVHQCVADRSREDLRVRARAIDEEHCVRITDISADSIKAVAVDRTAATDELQCNGIGGGMPGDDGVVSYGDVGRIFNANTESSALRGSRRDHVVEDSYVVDVEGVDTYRIGGCLLYTSDAADE